MKLGYNLLDLVCFEFVDFISWSSVYFI